MESNKNIVGKCPICGSNVIKTLKGYACEKSLEPEQSCKFFLFSSVGNRKLSDEEAKTFLEDKRILLDGFATKEGKNFTSVLSFNPDGSVAMNSQIGKCPKCGGTLYINNRAVSCSNFNNQQQPCNFTIWRNIGGHDLYLDEILEIINNGCTSEPITMYDSKGNSSSHKLGLDGNKDVVRL